LSIRQVAKGRGRILLVPFAIFFVFDHGLAVYHHFVGIRHLDTGDLTTEIIEVVVWICISIAWSYTLFKPLSARNSGEEGKDRGEQVEEI
jgi:hypothetical protein